VTTRIDLINRALTEIGSLTVTEDVSPGPDYVEIYETHVGGLVSSHPWTFQTKLAQLSRLSATPDAHWQYQFALPSDMLGTPRAVYASKDARAPTHLWDLRDHVLLSDHDEVWLRYTHAMDPARWPGYFIRLVVTVLKAEFQESVREDTAAAERLRRVAFGPPSTYGEGGMIAEAKKIDAQAHPAPKVHVGANPLIAVRRT